MKITYLLNKTINIKKNNNIGNIFLHDHEKTLFAIIKHKFLKQILALACC